MLNTLPVPNRGLTALKSIASTIAATAALTLAVAATSTAKAVPTVQENLFPPMGIEFTISNPVNDPIGSIYGAAFAIEDQSYVAMTLNGWLYQTITSATQWDEQMISQGFMTIGTQFPLTWSQYFGLTFAQAFPGFVLGEGDVVLAYFLDYTVNSPLTITNPGLQIDPGETLGGFLGMDPYPEDATQVAFVGTGGTAITTVAVSEPHAMALFALGLAGLGIARRKRLF